MWERFKPIVIAITVTLAVIGWCVASVLIFHGKDRELKLDTTQDQLSVEKLANATNTQKIDSLSKVNSELSKYKTLTQAMLYRDVATKGLEHSVGETVYLKNDSSKVAIEDIIIGGSKYNYYVRYKVKGKDNVEQEVIPELIY